MQEKPAFVRKRGKRSKIPKLYATFLLAISGWAVLSAQWIVRKQYSCTTGAFDVCFVTSIFGNSVSEVDQPADVDWYQRHWCRARFDVVTNLPDLAAPGWTKHLFNSTPPYHPIVQSRFPKFLAWKALPWTRTDCRMVVYMDGYLVPRQTFLDDYLPEILWTSTFQKFQSLADQVKKSEWGLAQMKQPYFSGMTMTSIFEKTIVESGKDTPEHAQATLTWMKQQEDYQEIIPYYLNKYLGT